MRAQENNSVSYAFNMNTKKQQLATTAQDLVAEPEDTERRKILEVTRRTDGSTRVWYRGEVLP